MLWWDSNFSRASTFVCSFRTFILYYGLRLLDLITIIDQGTDCRMWERAALLHNSGPPQMRGPSVGRSSAFDNLPRVMLRSTLHKPYIYPCILDEHRHLLLAHGKVVLHQVHLRRHVILPSHLVLPLSGESPSPSVSTSDIVTGYLRQLSYLTRQGEDSIGKLLDPARSRHVVVLLNGAILKSSKVKQRVARQPPHSARFNCVNSKAIAGTRP